VINLELALSDLSQVEKRLQRVSKDKTVTQTEKDALNKLFAALSDGKPARSVELTPEEERYDVVVVVLVVVVVVVVVVVGGGGGGDDVSVVINGEILGFAFFSFFPSVVVVVVAPLRLWVC